MATSRENKTISQFKSALIGGGARPNLFEVEMTTLPGGIAWDADNFRFMCKAANLPASNIANIDVPFRGRIFKVAGDRTIDTWTITIINDEGFALRNAFEEWVDLIAKLDNNLGATLPTHTCFRMPILPAKMRPVPMRLLALLTWMLLRSSPRLTTPVHVPSLLKHTLMLLILS